MPESDDRNFSPPDARGPHVRTVLIAMLIGAILLMIVIAGFKLH